MQPIYERYAQLLANYSLSLKPGERLLIQSTTLAEPLVREVYRAALQAGAHPHVQLSMRGEERIFFEEAGDAQLDYLDPLRKLAFEEFDAFLFVRAPFSTTENRDLPNAKKKRRNEALKVLSQAYSERTASRSLKRSLCEFPTLAMAQNARMDFDSYQQFIFNACRLFEPDPIAAWQAVHDYQAQIVEVLNQKSEIHYKGKDMDLRFSTKGRVWINSDGQTNMPSGEVYTTPVEDSVNGHIHFSYPAVYQGEEVEGVTLWVENGEVQKWEAQRGQHFLDKIFELPGARRFGEAAIGTNKQIDRFTRNILFDEKIGGTVHLAIGQAYLQTGGKNQSPIHWDMIADMTEDGEIFADGEKIYEKGQFLFLDA